MTEPLKSGLIIIGAGGHGRVVGDAAEALSRWGTIEFLDDRYPEMKSVGPWRVVGKIQNSTSMRPHFPDAAVAIGNNQLRLKLLRYLCESGFNLPVIAHPTAVISRHAQIEDGTVVFAQAVINIGAKLGMGCIVNTAATVDHDSVIGPAVHISPGANLAGGVTVGEASWIGIGASVRQEIIIGSNVVVGAGAAVVKNLSDGVTAVGVPARVVIKD